MTSRDANKLNEFGSGQHVPDGFLEPPTPDMVGKVFAGAATEIPVGQRFGSYRVTQFIASGGMGAVYRAVRDDGQFEKEVAVKILHRPFVTPDDSTVVSREQHILAKLEHQGIARLLDAGVTEFGFAYLIMELIDGTPIHAFCAAKQLGIDNKLDLFLRVCESVEYAHNRLVLHRDLKPANILVTEDGQPKIVDFGIAKLLDDANDGDESLMRTQAGTPQYAAPEQFENESATTATDVYALGIILYELAAGSCPYDLAGHTPTEARRVVRESDPRPPSLKTASKIDAAALAGDLDAIILKAIRHDPRQRYESVRLFSDDLDRHIDHFPVQARSGSSAYHAKRFMVRRKGLVIALVLLACVFCGGVTMSTIGFLSANRAKDRARLEAQGAEKTTEFLRKMLESVDPLNAGQRDVTLQQVLDSAARQIESESGDDPRVQGALARTIGLTYLRLGKLPQATEQLEKAVQHHRRFPGTGKRELAASLEALGRVDHANRESNRAVELMAESLSLRMIQDDSAFAESLMLLAAAEASCDMLAGAVVHQQQSLDILENLPNRDPGAIAGAKHGLADLLFDVGKPKQAIALHINALQTRSDHHGAIHPMTADSHQRLARAYMNSSDFASADLHLESAINILAKSAPNHPMKQLEPMLDRAEVQHKLDHPTRADELFKHALELANPLPPDHWVLAVARHRYINFLIQQQRYADAIPLAESVAIVLTEMLGPDHSNVQAATERVENLRGKAVLSRGNR